MNNILKKQKNKKFCFTVKYMYIREIINATHWTIINVFVLKWKPLMTY